MRKLKLVCLLGVFATGSVFASGIEIKGGVGSIKAAADKIGFDAAVGYAIKMERFFSIIPELGFNWINFDQCAGTTCQTVQIGGVTGTLTETRNHYTLPLMLNGRFNIPMGSDDVPVVQPFITVGAGYAWSFYESKTPAYSVSGVPVA